MRDLAPAHEARWFRTDDDVARRRQPQARLIALTGGQEDDKRRALEAGFDWHLTKPADPDALQAILRR